MVTSFGFQATAVWPPFVSGERVVYIHKLSGHMKCLVTHVRDLGGYLTTHRTKIHLRIISCCLWWTKPNKKNVHLNRSTAPHKHIQLFLWKTKNELPPKISVTRYSYSSIPMCAERFQCNETPAIRNIKTWGKSGPYTKISFPFKTAPNPL